MESIIKYGALGDGITDCSPAFEKAFKAGGEIYIPKGEYRLCSVLKIPSHTKICADGEAKIFAAGGCFTGGDIKSFVTNADCERGNEDITISGGIWDGNSMENHRENWSSGPCCGLLFGFDNVTGLKLENMTVQNSESFHIRLSCVTHFEIRNIVFRDDDYNMCQDGVHIGGGCHDGVVSGVAAYGKSTNDDLIALNADDVKKYCMCRGKKDAPISDILIENIKAENCHSGIRILSVTSKISNITVRNFEAGVRVFGINMDAARYCLDPIFDDADYPDGVGNLENILFENVTFWKTTKGSGALNSFETNGSFKIKNFKRLRLREPENQSKTVCVNHIAKHLITVDGKTETADKSILEFDMDSFESLEFSRV